MHVRIIAYRLSAITTTIAMTHPTGMSIITNMTNNRAIRNQLMTMAIRITTIRNVRMIAAKPRQS